MTDRKEDIRQKVAKAMCAGDGGYPATMADWFRRFAARVEEIKCRMRFKAVGHDHDCVLDPPCSRDYDPCPDSGCEPFPEEDYVGSGVAALYGGPTEAWQVLELAGWNVVKDGDKWV